MKLPVAAVFLSLAHLDHCGNVGVLDTSIPIVATPISFAILKGYQDVGKSGSEADVAYTSLRTPKVDEPQYLEIERGGYVGRDLVCTVSPPEPFLDFLGNKPGQSAKSKKLLPGTCGRMEELSCPFEVSAYRSTTPSTAPVGTSSGAKRRSPIPGTSACTESGNG